LRAAAHRTDDLFSAKAEERSLLSPVGRRRLSAGEGTKGARLDDWAYCELADLDAAEYDEQRSGLWTRGLLIRRNIADGDFAFFSTWCPVGTGIETLVMIEGHRWAIEDSFETAKNELGLDAMCQQRKSEPNAGLSLV
jgi:SRSO17 transposase